MCATWVVFGWLYSDDFDEPSDCTDEPDDADEYLPLIAEIASDCQLCGLVRRVIR